MVTPKMKALAAGLGSGFMGFLAFLANTPPSQQEGILGALLAVLPVAARPEIAAIAKLLGEIGLVYGIYQASHSGPATKPTTDVQTGAPVSQTTPPNPVPPSPPRPQ